MNTHSELRTMVSSLRVHELQAILGCANQQRHGRKQDLIERILHLVEYSGQNSSNALCLKIKEVYRRRFPTQAAPEMSRARVDLVARAGPQPGPSRAQPTAYRAPNTLGSGQQTISTFARSSATLPVSNGIGHAQPSTVVPFPPRNQSSLKIFRLPFCDHLDTVIPITPLIGKHSGRNEVVYSFNILNHQKYLTELMSFTESKPLPRNEIQLRFLRYEPGETLRDDFPPQCHVKIGEQPVTLPPTIPTNKPNVEPKRQPLPVNITSATMANINSLAKLKLQINWVPDRERNFFFVISLVRKVTSEILLQRLKNNGERPSAYTKQKIVEKMNLDTDADICTESLRVSLNCPLGMMRIQIPGKGKDCDHIQCFDATLYVKMNEKKPGWKCPVCHKLAHFDDLIIDGYFKEVLDRLKSDTESAEIEVFKDGNWKVVCEDGENPPPPPSSSKPSPAKSSLPALSLAKPSLPDSSSGPKAASSSGAMDAKKEEEVECIDLISDGSDDEDSSGPSSAPPSRPATTEKVQVNGSVKRSASVRSSESPSIIVLDSPPSRSPSSRLEDEPRGEKPASPPAKRQAVASAAASTYSGFTAPTLSIASARIRTQPVAPVVTTTSQPSGAANIFNSVFPGFAPGASSNSAAFANGVSPAFTGGMSGFAGNSFGGSVPQIWESLTNGNQRTDLFPAYAASVVSQYGYPSVDASRVVETRSVAKER